MIGAYQNSEPGQRTVFVSTHMIGEFEGLIDDFTILERGRNVLTLNADTARERYQRIYARFTNEAPALQLPGAQVNRRGWELEVVASGDPRDVVDRLRSAAPEELSAEAFLTTVLGSMLTAPLAALVLSVVVSNRHQMLVTGIGPAPSARVTVIGLLLLAVCLAIVLGFGLANHRSVERTRWQIAGQLAAVSACLAFAVGTWIAVTMLP